MKALPSKLDSIGNELSQKRRDYSRLNRTKYTTGFDFGINEAYAGIVEFLRDETRWSTIVDAGINPSDPVEARKAEILRKAFRPFHLSNEMTVLASDMQKLTSRLSAVLNTHLHPSVQGGRCREERSGDRQDTLRKHRQGTEEEGLPFQDQRCGTPYRKRVPGPSPDEKGIR